MNDTLTFTPTPKIDFETVMKLIRCTPDNPIYNEMTYEFSQIYEEAFSLLKPIGILGFGALTKRTATADFPAGTKIIYAITSIGDSLSHRSSKAFSDGDYIKGMLYDAMADSALFSLDIPIQTHLHTLCRTHKIGILRSLDAPSDISMEIHQEAWKALELKKNFGIKITDSFMLDPIKSMCKIFVVCENSDIFNAAHNCKNCPNQNCSIRQDSPVEITVINENSSKSFQLGKNDSLAEGLIRNGFYINSPCGGVGLCGKCKVRIIKGSAAVSSNDKNLFTASELNSGYRLSCTMYPTEDITIELKEHNEYDFEAVSIDTDLTVTETDNGEYKIAIDIGTTTIAFALMNDKGNICASLSSVNNQRRYGADIISRINAANTGKQNELAQSIRIDLSDGINSLCGDFGISVDQISQITISANTTMTHLLLKYDCFTLTQYPFTPVNIDIIKGKAKDLIGLDCNANVTLLPGISTYIGGDIVSGLYKYEFDKNDDICLLVDLGTNGEMALGNRNKILAASTAAGPAFEGCNISCGTGSIPGAICSAEITNNKAIIHTIHDKAPIGICGTGVIEITAELLKANLLDETGLLCPIYFDSGFPISKTADGNDIIFTQSDIRELQLAKSAIYAGIQTLLLRYGITAKQVARVYIAGGFGYKLNIDKAVKIRMLPNEFSDSAQAVGNSSLAGAIKSIKNSDCENSFHKLISISKEINLSADQDFANFFIESMMF